MGEEDNERSSPIERMRTQVTNVRIEVATLRTEVTQIKWVFGVILGANLVLNVMGVQVSA